jgi:hypothetical protein
MGDPYKGRLAGHALRWDRTGKSSFSPVWSTCECGKSPFGLSSLKQAREWHRIHKAEMIDTFVSQGVDDRGRPVHL